MTYSEKLLNPKWQKKRLAIFERDKYTCRLCKDNETTLHIHHHFYLKDYEPWDYQDDDLITYCKHCHALVEALKSAKGIHRILNVFKYSNNGKILIVCFLCDLQNQKHCAIFEYIHDEIECLISLPEHIIERCKEVFYDLKLQNEWRGRIKKD